jgi:hypothetical protein
MKMKAKNNLGFVKKLLLGGRRGLSCFSLV